MVVLKDTNEDEIDSMKVYCQKLDIKLQLINHFSLNNSKQENYELDRPPKCLKCNRIRLLADGILKPCLHSEDEYKIDFNNIAENLKTVIMAKPQNGQVCNSRKMYEIGGEGAANSYKC